VAPATTRAPRAAERPADVGLEHQTEAGEEQADGVEHADQVEAIAVAVRHPAGFELRVGVGEHLVPVRRHFLDVLLVELLLERGEQRLVGDVAHQRRVRFGLGVGRLFGALFRGGLGLGRRGGRPRLFFVFDEVAGGEAHRLVPDPGHLRGVLVARHVEVALARLGVARVAGLHDVFLRRRDRGVVGVHQHGVLVVLLGGLGGERVRRAEGVELLAAPLAGLLVGERGADRRETQQHRGRELELVVGLGFVSQKLRPCLIPSRSALHWMRAKALARLVMHGMIQRCGGMLPGPIRQRASTMRLRPSRFA
jgi:hypothetical protein